MTWESLRQLIRSAQLKGLNAEIEKQWHIVVQQYLYCYEEAERVNAESAARYFATKLSIAYRQMDMPIKSAYYRLRSERSSRGQV
jgi:hypothetical protein